MRGCCLPRNGRVVLSDPLSCRMTLLPDPLFCHVTRRGLPAERMCTRGTRAPCARMDAGCHYCVAVPRRVLRTLRGDGLVAPVEGGEPRFPYRPHSCAGVCCITVLCDCPSAVLSLTAGVKNSSRYDERRIDIISEKKRMTTLGHTPSLSLVLHCLACKRAGALLPG